MTPVTPIDEDARLQRLQQVFEEQKASGEQTGAVDAELLHDIIVWIRALRAQAADALDRAGRADVVQVLPASAPAGQFLVKAGDPNLYIGAGMQSPLRKIPTQAV